jgi:hypothetical protein
MKTTCLFIAVLLVACTEAPPKQQVIAGVEKIETIKIPVLMPCVTLHDIPSIPATNLRVSEDAVVMVDLLRADIDDFKIYAITVDSLLRSCASEFIQLPDGTKSLDGPKPVEPKSSIFTLPSIFKFKSEKK